MAQPAATAADARTLSPKAPTEFEMDEVEVPVPTDILYGPFRIKTQEYRNGDVGLDIQIDGLPDFDGWITLGSHPSLDEIRNAVCQWFLVKTIETKELKVVQA